MNALRSLYCSLRSAIWLLLTFNNSDGHLYTPKHAFVEGSNMYLQFKCLTCGHTRPALFVRSTGMEFDFGVSSLLSSPTPPDIKESVILELARVANGENRNEGKIVAEMRKDEEVSPWKIL